MKRDNLESVNDDLISEIEMLIEQSKNQIAVSVNATITLLYWEIGRKINNEVLREKRAKYGKQIVSLISEQLILQYGGSFSEKNLRRMMQFATVFHEKEIVVSLIRQFSWTHFLALIPIEDPLKRMFYIEMCKIENWSVRTFRERINSMLYERTAISKKPESLIRELHKTNIKVADYFTILPPKEVLLDRLRQAITIAQNQIKARED